MDIRVIIPFFLVLFYVVHADLSLTSTALIQDRQYYESTVDNAAQAVLKKLSKDKSITEGSRISKIDLEDTRVAESILYSIGVEVARGSTYEMQFVQPISKWHPMHMSSALPGSVSPKHPTAALALHGNVPTFSPPEMSVTLQGPLELFFPHSTTDIIIKTPRYADVGFVDRIIVTEGTNITLSGAVELRMRDSLSMDEVRVDGDNLVINTNDKLKINVYGHHIEITNAVGEQLKVQKKFSSVVEISAHGRTVVKTTRIPFEIPLNDSRLQTFQYALMDQLDAPFPHIRKISSGSRMEAVLGFIIPLEVEDTQAGTSSSWDVVVAKGSNHKETQVISVERKKIRNEVGIAKEIIANNTVSYAMADFNRYLQNTRI